MQHLELEVEETPEPVLCSTKSPQDGDNEPLIHRSSSPVGQLGEVGGPVLLDPSV